MPQTGKTLQAETFRQDPKRHRQVLNSERMAAIGLVSLFVTRKFNDPLQAITNILGGIHRRGSLGLEDLPLVDLAYQEIRNLNKLVREMREIYLPSHGKTEKIDVPLALNAVIAESQELFDKKCNITMEVPENAVYVHAIAGQLRTVLQCLVDNVLKACGEHDTIHISVAVVKETIELRLKSSEGGNEQKAIAQLFASLDGSHAEESSEIFELVKSYAIIAMHGGTLTANIDGQEISGFQVNLPIHDGANEMHTAS